MELRYLKNKELKSELVNIEFELSTDILVIGLGTAGTMAAFSAAKEGFSVLGVEQQDRMGGVGTAACVWDYYYGTPSFYSNELNEQVKALGFIETTENEGQVSINGQAKTIVLEREANKLGVKRFYNSVVVGVFVEDKNEVVGARILKNGKFINIKSKILIDNSYCCASRLAGCEMTQGRKSDGKTMRFSATLAKKQNGLLKGSWSNRFFSDSESITDLSNKILNSFANPPCYPEKGETSFPLVFGSLIGHREKDAIIADESYSLADYLDGVNPNKPIMYATAPVDNTNKDFLQEDEDVQDFQVICSLHCSGITPAIPLGAIFPKGFENILVASKGIGLNRGLRSCVRMRFDMERLGEAVGIICARSLSENVEPRNVNYEVLKEKLSEKGIYNEAHNLTLFSLLNLDYRTYKCEKLPATNEEIIEGLSSNAPEYAFYKIRTTGKNNADLIECLRKNLSSQNKRLKQSAAIALGMLGEKSVLENLKEIANSPEEIFSHINEKAAYFWMREISHNNKLKAEILIKRLESSK